MGLAVKRPDWLSRLEAYLYRVEHREFSYGQSDCLAFGRGVVEAMTGCDPGASFAAYASRFGALRLMKRCGHSSILEAVDRTAVDLGWMSVPHLDAQTGDIAVLRGEPLHSIAVGWGGGFAAQSLTGVLVVPAIPISVWRIPHEVA